MSTRRSYADPCGVARALDAVGERWALLVVRDLLLGPKRFTDLSAGLPGLSQNVLSQRLRDLEEQGVVIKRKLGPPARVQVYELTARGAELEPVVIALARWGSRAPLITDAPLGTDALVLALRTTFAPEVVGGATARYDLRLGDERFDAEFADGRFRIARGTPERPDAAIHTDAATLRALVFAGAPLEAARNSGAVTVTGDEKAITTFVRAFPRPPLDPCR